LATERIMRSPWSGAGIFDQWPARKLSTYSIEKAVGCACIRFRGTDAVVLPP
jgi:hypothetical protein